MKVVFEFELPEARAEYEMYRQAHDFHGVLFEFRSWLRNKRKHSPAWTDDLETVWEELHRLMADYGVAE